MSAVLPNESRANEIAALLAAPPPRRVPPALLRSAQGQSRSGVFILVGGIFLLFGMFFVSVFFPWNFYREIRLAAADTATTRGRVISTTRTSMSVRKTRVIGYAFEFETRPGAPVRGECYTTGPRWRAGEMVAIRYRPEEPAVCCIVGARLDAAGMGAAFMLLFPLLGSAFIIGTIVVRRRIKALLETGFLAEALVTGVEPTLMTVNNRRVHKITLQRSDSPEGGTFVVKQVAREAIDFARGRMAAGQPVYVLYDPAKPQRAMLPETL